MVVVSTVRERIKERKKERKKVGWLVSWCSKPSQPQRVTSGLRKKESMKEWRSQVSLEILPNGRCFICSWFSIHELCKDRSEENLSPLCTNHFMTNIGRSAHVTSCRTKILRTKSSCGQKCQSSAHGRHVGQSVSASTCPFSLDSSVSESLPRGKESGLSDINGCLKRDESCPPMLID